ncbi:Wadjet anti-phage system protein JetD domain-containing protein [Ghiorsea bivora]|uniref:Wadjet anti-phage system protein JetD domain-containing protein n=1 Tax=Ghiorsea bivora TaxID=1485545 RepID=UPI00057088A7|nr:Wadjet anti-phage system protein JetD domain-containing protein [Ghiorsea bivora]
MKWTTTAEIKAQVERRWQRGDICRAHVGHESTFPLSITLSKPSAKVMLEAFSQMQDWVKSILAYANQHQLTVEWHNINHRILGQQRIPARLLIQAPEQAARLIGKSQTLKQYDSLNHLTYKRLLTIQPWVLEHPLKVLKLASVWDKILDICVWIMAHPRPRIYLRQVNIPNIDSKFIEQHKQVLTALFDIILPAFAIDDDYTGTAGFARRYGFLEKPAMLRVRPLDVKVAIIHSAASQDIMLTANAFASLDPSIVQQIKTVFIVENEINYLAFPEQKQALLIFGSGYGFEALKKARWLQYCNLYYWGDIDTHGFAILNQLRTIYAHTQSFLMDEETLLRHQSFWGTEPKQKCGNLSLLHPEEKRLYNQLCSNTLSQHIRLEQERIAFSDVLAAIQSLALNPS